MSRLSVRSGALLRKGAGGGEIVGLGGILVSLHSLPQKTSRYALGIITHPALRQKGPDTTAKPNKRRSYLHGLQRRYKAKK